MNFNLITDTTLSITPGILWGIAWKANTGFNNLSSLEACSSGFTNEGVLNQGLQFFNMLKDQEKHSNFCWAVTAVPIVTSLLYKCTKNDLNYDMKDLNQISKTCFNTLKENMTLINAVSFISTTIPLYSMARSVKNTLWTGAEGLDPSGHVMFKVIQQGMLISTLSLSDNPRLNLINGCFVLANVLADTAMLANTTANCHTLDEVLVGVTLGMATLATSLLVNRMAHKFFNTFW